MVLGTNAHTSILKKTVWEESLNVISLFLSAIKLRPKIVNIRAYKKFVYKLMLNNNKVHPEHPRFPLHKKILISQAVVEFERTGPEMSQ